MSARRIVASALLLTALTACSGTAHVTSATPHAAPGATTAGDPITPGGGDGGYDVRHYDLDLRITPRAQPSLVATATIGAAATQTLSRFDLDLTGLDVARVTVDGAPARFTRAPGKLVVTPARPIAPGAFTVSVAYSGTPREIDDRRLGKYGWITTGDGIFVGDEPDARAHLVPRQRPSA